MIMHTYRYLLRITAILIVISVATLLVWQQRHLSLAREEITRLRSENASLPALREDLARLRGLEVDHAELARMRESQTAIQLELARLRGQKANTIRAEAENSRLRTELERQTAQEQEASKAFAGPMAEVTRSTLEKTYQRRLVRMQERLKLSPEQAAAIQKIFSRQAQGIAEATKGIWSGKPDREKIAAIRQERGNPDAQIAAVLSREQQTAYAAFKDDERADNARQAANGELLRMENDLGLTTDQREKVYAVLYDQSLFQSKEEPAGSPARNPAEAMQSALERKLAALEGVLTPSQLESYRQQEQRQLDLMKKIVAQIEPTPDRP